MREAIVNTSGILGKLRAAQEALRERELPTSGGATVTTRAGVLIVIDMQNGFINQHGEHVVPVVAELVDTWYTAGNDVVFTATTTTPAARSSG